MRILFLGDIVGKGGKRLVRSCLPKLREREQLDFVIANGENCDDGSGIKPGSFRDICSSGVDAMTLGDHIYKKREIYGILENDPRVVKPANFPASAPGKPWTVVNWGEIEIGIFSLLGRVFMRPVDCPFEAAERVLSEIPDSVKVIFVDVHAEATSDKQLLGRFLDGKVTAVLGTHTHVATADEHVMPGGTAFQCDVGMSGPHDSVIGRDFDRVLETTRTFKPRTFKVPNGDVRLSGSILEVDELSGRALSINRIVVREDEDWIPTLNVNAQGSKR